jgi:uncharacterized protein YcnI
MRPRVAAAIAIAALAVLPTAAQAHVSLHPNTLPQGAFATVDVRVPSESATAKTTRVELQLPPGITDASLGYLPGWKVSTTTRKLAQPVTGNGGVKIDS